jgi:hypothetical protein
MGALVSNLGAQDTVEDVPAFMLMDGAYLATQGHLAQTLGHIRFEGHGTARIKPTEDAPQEYNAEWTVLADDVVRLELTPQLPHLPAALLLSAGEQPDTIEVRAELDGALHSATLYRFEAEDAEEHIPAGNPRPV